MLFDAKPVKVLADAAALNTLSEAFGLTDDIVIMVEFKTGVTAGVVRLESAPRADYTGTWKTEVDITFAGTPPLTLSDRIIPEGAVGRLRISTAIADGVIDAYIERHLTRR
jgi:hypothetical protein